MKKRSLFIVGAICLVVGAGLMAIYDACKGSDEAKAIDVEKTVMLDKEYIIANFDGYQKRYYETCILMSDFLDTDDAYVAGVSNVFQVQKKSDVNANDTVALEGTISTVFAIGHSYQHDSIAVKRGLWVEDWDMFKYEGNIITFAEAYEKVKETNFVMPHSQYVVLRWEVGPVDHTTYAPQYIFGNTKNHLYVDATTGNVTDVNPAGL